MYPHLRFVVGEVLQSIRRKIRFRAAKCILDTCKKGPFPFFNRPNYEKRRDSFCMIFGSSQFEITTRSNYGVGILFQVCLTIS